MAEGMPWEVQHFDPPAVVQSDRLPALESLVDRRVPTTHRLQLGKSFCIRSREPVRLVPEVVLRHHRVVRLDPAPVELVAGEACPGVKVPERTVPSGVVEVGVADEDVVDRLERESDGLQVGGERLRRRERHAGVEEHRARGAGEDVLRHEPHAEPRLDAVYAVGDLHLNPSSDPFGCLA